MEMPGIEKASLEEVLALKHRVSAEIHKVFIGPDRLIDLLLTALFSQGHIFLEGVPGIAKTTLVKAFSQTIGCQFKRIQFTPDLLPSDITGTFVLNLKTNEFEIRKGPIFANIILGDEINRATAKTQSALLEVMQERQITIEGNTYPLSSPFMVLATQNPIEHEGVYPLPEAQVDRFLMKVKMDYPDIIDEKKILLTYNQKIAEIQPILSQAKIQALIQLASQIHIDEELVDYIIQIGRATREHPQIYLGASPRGLLSLMYAAKSHALLTGRSYVIPDDIKILAPFVICHRLILSSELELEGVKAETVFAEILQTIRWSRKGN